MIWKMTNNLSTFECHDDIFIVYGQNSISDSLVLSEILIPDELIFSERLKGEEQKETWLSCRASLRLILATILNVNPKFIELQKGKYGKLYIANSNLFFNVSHSKNAFLIGLSNKGRIGIDIEILTGFEDLPSLVNFAFSKEEAKYCHYGKSPDLFTKVWTLKEAFLKAAGVGLIDKLSGISVVGNLNNDILHFAMYQKSFLCPNGEIGSIVYRKKNKIKYIWFLT